MRGAANYLRALPEQRGYIDHAAHLLDKNRSDIMRESARDSALTVLVDQVFFHLHMNKFAQFTAMLG